MNKKSSEEMSETLIQGAVELDARIRDCLAKNIPCGQPGDPGVVQGLFCCAAGLFAIAAALENKNGK